MHSHANGIPLTWVAHGPPTLYCELEDYHSQLEQMAGIMVNFGPDDAIFTKVKDAPSLQQSIPQIYQKILSISMDTAPTLEQFRKVEQKSWLLGKKMKNLNNMNLEEVKEIRKEWNQLEEEVNEREKSLPELNTIARYKIVLVYWEMDFLKQALEKHKTKLQKLV